MSPKFNRKQVKKVWRKLFEELFIGDRVTVLHFNRKRVIVGKALIPPDCFCPIPHWEYKAEFDHYMRLPKEYFSGEKSCCRAISKVFYEDMKFIR